MTNAKHSDSLTYLTPIDLVVANKNIGKLDTESSKEFCTFKLTVNDAEIHLKCNVPLVDGELKQSQFNTNKLQLAVDCSGNGHLLLAAEQLRKEIQTALDNECLPDYSVSVISFVKGNNVMYLSWPRKGTKYETIKVDGRVVDLNTKSIEYLEGKLREASEGGKEVEVLFKLYCWVRYEKNKEGNSTGIVTVGISPQLQGLNFGK